nr:unnamed protein product [Digitaria exilis]
MRNKPPEASPQGVRAAYRSLVRQWHPDKHPSDSRPEAEAQFKAITEAYERFEAGCCSSPRAAPVRPRATGSRAPRPPPLGELVPADVHVPSGQRSPRAAPARSCAIGSRAAPASCSLSTCHRSVPCRPGFHLSASCTPVRPFAAARSTQAVHLGASDCRDQLLLQPMTRRRHRQLRLLHLPRWPGRGPAAPAPSPALAGQGISVGHTTRSVRAPVRVGDLASAMPSSSGPTSGAKQRAQQLRLHCKKTQED